MLKLFFLLSLFLTHSALAETDPKTIVEEVFRDASQELINTDEALQANITKRVDFEAMAKAVIAKSKIPSGEFPWFQNTLHEIITRTVYPEAPSFLKNVNITYKAVEINGDSATVHSAVKRKAELTDVSYKLQKQGQGDWRVVDISIDGESWVGNIKEQVASTLKKKNWKGLKEALNRRLEKLRQGKKA